MKHLIITLAFASSCAYAEAPISAEKTTVVCGKTTEVFEALYTTFKERITWSGHDLQTNAISALWQNQEEGTYSFTLTIKEKTCIYSAGKYTSA